MIYGGALLGEILGQTFFFLLPLGNALFGLVLIAATAPGLSLGFLFIALGGFALSNLSHQEGDPVEFAGRLTVPLAAFVVGTVGSLLLGALSLQGAVSSTEFVGLIALLAVLLSLPVQFFVFYFIGRKVPVNGHTFRCFGLLFVGGYVGSVVGTVVSVAVFGQASWVVQAGTAYLYLVNGIVYLNTPLSLQLLIESLNPIASLPSLPSLRCRYHALAGLRPGSPQKVEWSLTRRCSQRRTADPTGPETFSHRNQPSKWASIRVPRARWEPSHLRVKKWTQTHPQTQVVQPLDQPRELIVDVLPVTDKKNDDAIRRSFNLVNDAVVPHPDFPELGRLQLLSDLWRLPKKFQGFHHARSDRTLQFSQ